MELNYQSEIIEKHEKSLTVKFYGDGLTTVIVGCPYPPVGTDRVKFFEQYAPLHLWYEDLLARQDVEVGVIDNNTVRYNEPTVLENLPEPIPTMVLETHSL